MGSEENNRWFRNFQQINTFYTGYSPSDIDCKLLDFRASTEFIEKDTIIICGIYDMICFFKIVKGKKEIYRSKFFTNTFVKTINIEDIACENPENLNIAIKVIGAPEIKIARSTWLDIICKYLPFIPGKINITVSGAICCEIKSIKENNISYNVKKKVNRLQNFDIICIASTRWDFIWQRPQQLMFRLSKYNRVLFFEHSYTARKEVIEEKINDPGLWDGNLSCVNQNLWVFSPLHVENDNKADGLSKEYNYRVKSSCLQYLKEKLDFARIIIISYLPQSINYLNDFEYRLLVYDCVDNFSGFSWSSPDTAVLEKRLIQSSDLIVTTAKSLEKRIKELNLNTYLLPNAVDFLHFNKASINGFNNKNIFKKKNSTRPLIGYMGAFFEWVDEDLMIFLADNKPDWDFMIVGPVQPGIGRRLFKRKNVYFMGEINYFKLPAYIQDFDVCLIPFKINEVTESANPIKMWEYLATGKPVVSTAIPEVEELQDLIYIAKDKYDFLYKLGLALNESNYTRALRRIIMAGENDWQDRAFKLMELMNWTLSD